MTAKERMLAELPYRAADPELGADNLANKKRLYEYNTMAPGNFKRQEELIKEILANAGKACMWSRLSAVTTEGILRWERTFIPIII